MRDGREVQPVRRLGFFWGARRPWSIGRSWCSPPGWCRWVPTHQAVLRACQDRARDCSVTGSGSPAASALARRRAASLPMPSDSSRLCGGVPRRMRKVRRGVTPPVRQPHPQPVVDPEPAPLAARLRRPGAGHPPPHVRSDTPTAVAISPT
jgi:hypothetical protein